MMVMFCCICIVFSLIYKLYREISMWIIFWCIEVSRCMHIQILSLMLDMVLQSLIVIGNRIRLIITTHNNPTTTHPSTPFHPTYIAIPSSPIPNSQAYTLTAPSQSSIEYTPITSYHPYL